MKPEKRIQGESAFRRGPTYGPAVGVLVSVLLLGACEPRFPLFYLREAAGPGTSLLAPPEPASITEDLPRPVDHDWDSIVARDTLAALLTFNSTGYFIHRGEPLGFEYELLQAFAETHDLALAIEVVRTRRRLFRMLYRGEGDVVAARLVAAPEYRDVVLLTDSLYQTRPVLVQRSDPPSDTAAATPARDTAGLPPLDTGAVRLRARLLLRPSDLAGREVYMPAGSDYYDRLVELSDSMGERIEIVEVENADQVEPLIQAVAAGRIQLTVSQENLADLSRARFANIVARPVVGPAQPVVWAVRPNAPELREKVNEWLRSEEGQTLTTVLYRKYFVDRKGYLERVQDDLLAHQSGVISPYDTLLERHARGLGWDWRLLAAQVAQESRFDPGARSWAGARGLLQLMPRTAREMGVRNVNDPRENVAGGVRYLGWLSGLWEDEVPDPVERLKFVLASYNAGRGHVLDAQRLAEKHGGDPRSWEDVAYWLLQKSKPSVYQDPVVQHGYVRGLEPVQYVSRILERYDRYRSVQ